MPRIATRDTHLARSGNIPEGATPRIKAHSAVPVQSAIRQCPTLTFRRSLVASRRNAAFLRFDSTRVTEVSGRRIATGSPGNPAPEPTSTSELDGGSSRCKKADSPKCRFAIPAGSRTAVRFMRVFQRCRIPKCPQRRTNCSSDAATPSSSRASRRDASNVTRRGACPES